LSPLGTMSKFSSERVPTFLTSLFLRLLNALDLLS